MLQRLSSSTSFHSMDSRGINDPSKATTTRARISGCPSSVNKAPVCPLPNPCPSMPEMRPAHPEEGPCMATHPASPQAKHLTQQCVQLSASNAIPSLLHPSS
ncbi:hypothetical protein BDP55DRAFT_24010 [Colletotrichum godetiae]|uniref:Uncharacterized protein n=1 Tax=Colletotrichum godetiae TaxID=1209918 RepID=A0AAJ0F3D8_9PEZI|nr:uncharacterized protein BDP55DRAFT_24010 [Colletotrichum godetiae]KAK1701566.1 hypothetical protein BDP55DRAFT_24010 [Colletotrichum godetiae]